MSIELHILLLCAKKKELRISDISHSDKCGVPRDVCTSSADRRAVCGYRCWRCLADSIHSEFLRNIQPSIYRILIRVNNNSEIKMDSRQYLQVPYSDLLIWVLQVTCLSSTSLKIENSSTYFYWNDYFLSLH